jgi:class 3 adenylate cyclase/tetratricopeptide (TPR) repeat protein
MNLAPLQSHLNPELAAHLARTGELPPADRVRLGAALHAELTACAAFIPTRLVRAQLADPQPGRTGGAFWEGSLLFADLSGFTALSEQLSVLGRQGAEEVSAVVNRLFSALVAEIQHHHGTLLKFGGDALTAFFDADALGYTHAAAAATAALAMQQRMLEFVDLPTRAGTFTLRLRVGVHSGRVFAAEVGDASHIELVVTGPEVNRVAYAQEIAAPGETVITAATAAYFPHAPMTPAVDGFLRITTLPPLTLPAAPPNPIPSAGAHELADLARRAAQLEALRPYLVRGLPQRFLASADAGLGEFRPVTVLFANVADFGPLITHLHNDAPRAAAIFNAYFRRAQAVVHRYDGIVNKVDMATHGDKLMALFGAPSAHEDDPTRAAHCAWELGQALEEANREIGELLHSLDKRTWKQQEVDQASFPLPPLLLAPLSQKIGLNTGTVFAGRVGGATRYEYTVMGSTVNLAARLMSAAGEGAIFLSPSTRAAVAGHALLRDGPPLTLKGIATPVVPTLLTGLQSGQAAPTAPATRLTPAPLIGRDAELDMLLTAAAAALRGQGRVLALIGEAGTGKTRLHEELMRRLVLASAAGGPTALRVPPFEIFLSDCQSYDQRTPYAALRPLFRDLLGISSAALSSAAVEAQLSARVRRFAPARERFLPLLNDLLGIALNETNLTTALSPQQRHDRLQELVIDLVRGISRRAPLIITVEDIHWADASSLDLLARMAGAAADMPLLLALTYRPEPPIPAPWLTLPTTIALRLRELSPADSAILIDALLGGGMPAGLQALVERTQGNPFFIEELVRALVAGGILVRDAAGAWRLSRPLAEVTLPTSIEGLLTARLDRLDEPRQELVEVASVIGRRFQRPVVEGVYAHPAPLDDSLNQLIAIELILADQFDRILAYLFRHALLRDVAYERILYARRRVLHARVARQIEAIGPEQVEEQFAPLAWHYLLAEEWAPALAYHLRAAEQARRRFANRDALALYRTALEIAPRLAATSAPAALVEQVAAIHEAIGDLHLLLGEYELAEAQFREALALAGAGSGPVSERWLRLHRLLATLEERRSRYDAAFQWLHVGMARATSALRGEMARCHLLGAGIYFRQGAYIQAMEWSQMGLRLAEQVQSRTDQAHALLLLGNLRQEQGDLVQSISAFEQAHSLFEELNDLSRATDALNNLGSVYLRAGRWQDTIRCYEQSLERCEQIGDVQAIARTANNLAVVLVGRNQLARAAELYQLSSAMFGQIGSALGVAVTTYNRGEVLLLQGQPGAALPLFAAAIAEMERINARGFLPDVLRLQAEAHLARHEYAAAEAAAARSLSVADELRMGAEAAVARRVLGQIALTAGDLSAAHTLLEQARGNLAQIDNRYELGRTLYHLARLAAAQGDPTARDAFAADAAAIFRELDAERDLALISTLNET